MRDYNEVMNQILGIAKADDDIRVVIMNGSRVNCNIEPDIMQDYDIVFFLKDFDMLGYKKNQEWIKQFGELVIMQQNDFDDGSYIFLMQFIDGIRIDLSFCNIDSINRIINSDTLTKILIDKDNCVGEISLPSDRGYWVKKPKVKEWNELLNDLWWIQTYIAKGLWRDELTYAKYMYDVVLIDGIRQLLSWYIGEQADWHVNVGKCGKFFKSLLDVELYGRFVELYVGSNYEDIWEGLFDAGMMLRSIGVELSEKLNYIYPFEEDKNVTDYIRRIRKTSKEATRIAD